MRNIVGNISLKVSGMCGISWACVFVHRGMHDVYAMVVGKMGV